MAQEHDLGSPRSVKIGRWAAVVLAVGAASASALVAGGTAGASTKSAKLTVVKVGNGKVLSNGDTVYTLKASSTPCTATCLTVWPAVVLPSRAKHATAGSGVSASKLGTVKVAGVGTQVTYGGKRLYRFSGDTAPGQVNGNVTDTWGKWTDVVVSKTSGSSNSGSNSGASNAGSGGASF